MNRLAQENPVLALARPALATNGASPQFTLACAKPLSNAEYADIRLRMIFDCGKFDSQVGDVEALSRFPLLIEQEEYQKLAAWAERLHGETLAAEAELLTRPDLHRRLGLPFFARRALRGAVVAAPAGVCRHMRFDFHPTSEGWRISEVNCDVPGGFIEAAAFTRLLASHYPGTEPPPDPASTLIEGIAAHVPAGDRVAFVHATAYTDDGQVMAYFAREASARGLRPLLLAPDHLRWKDGQAFSTAAGYQGALGAMVRFFPGEWLPNLPRRCGWKHWFARGRTPMCNPASALVTQSKRFPLVWAELSAALPTWRALAPATIEPSCADMGEEWVLKPAMGRVGGGIGLHGVTSAKDWKAIRRDLFWWRGHWAAQARFEAIPIDAPRGAVYPCLGIYTIDGRAAGIYGRISRRPLIDDQAQDVAVLIRRASAQKGLP